MAKQIGFLYVGNQLTLVLRGHPYDVDPQHPKFHEIVATMKRPENETDAQEEFRCEKLLSLVRADHSDLRAVAAEVGFNDIQVDHGVVTVKGKALHNSLTSRIVELKKRGLPFEPLVRFLVNLEKNPSEASKEALFDFLEKGRFPLTEDGCFLGYKGVKKGRLKRADGTTYETLVDCHSGRFDMAPGNSHSMPWSEVDDNRNQACGAGFHVGTIEHARGFGAVMIVVKVNPKDCVSVPRYDTTKLRCCAYEVINVYSDKDRAKEFVKPVYSTEEVQEEAFEEAEQEYILATDMPETRRAQLEAMGRDDLCRLGASEGIFLSTNEARWLGKALVLEALMKGKLPLDLMSASQVAELAARRKLYSTATNASKRGVENLKKEILEDHEKRNAPIKE